MAAHSLDTLLRLWALNHLTTEQAIGQVLQVLAAFEPRLVRLEQTMTAPPPAPAPALPLPTPIATPPTRKTTKHSPRRRLK